MLLHLAVALTLALPSAVLARNNNVLFMDEGSSQVGVNGAGMMLGAHSSGWVVGADEDGVSTGFGALRRLTMKKPPPVRIRSKNCTTLKP